MAEGSSGPVEETVAPGRRLGNLLVDREIGRGGFSTVYLARDVLIGRPVALKVVRPPEVGAGEAREKFLSEARIVGALRSPRIVTLYGVHELEAGGWAFEMEYLDGGTLQDRVRSGRGLSPEEAVPILRAVLEGLAAAHAAGVLHRDLKPGNVLLGRDGTVKLADFGLARLAEGAVLHMRNSGKIEGTPWYMAPELLMREQATAASDLWAVGVLAYEVLTGRVAFDQPDLPSLFYAVQNARPRELAERVPRALGLLVSRCMQKRPEDRPASAKEALDLLEHSTASLPSAVMERAAYEAEAARLAGRGKETARIDSLLGSAKGGRATVVLVTGEAGVGKSALLREARFLAEHRGFAVLEARVTAAEGPLRPLLRAARSASGGGRAEEAPVPPLEARDRAVLALEQALGDLAAEKPLCATVEDFQLAREDDVHLLRDLRHRLADRPLLLLLACRTESPGLLPRASAEDRGASALTGAEDVEKIELGPLAPEALYRVLEVRSRATVPPEVAARIAERSGGNVLVALAMVRHLEEAGGLVREGDGAALRVNPGWERIPLPQGVRETVEMRLAGLAEEDRALLDAAAVDGMEFDGQALAAATGRPLLDVLRSLQRLVRRGGIVRPREDGYRFAHAAVRDVIYEALGAELRREIHRGLAEHLAPRAESVDPARLATHWEGAGDPERAAPLFLRAASAAAVRQELRRAAERWDRARSHAESLPAEALGARAMEFISIAWILHDLGRGDEAEALFQRVLDATSGPGHSQWNAVVRTSLALLRFRTRGADPAAEEEFRRAASAPEPSRVRGLASYSLGLLARRGGDIAAARGHHLRAQQDFSVMRMESYEAVVVMELGSVSLREGDRNTAERLYAEAARLYRRRGSRSNAAVAEVNRCRVARMRGRLTGLPEALESAVRTLSLEGNRKQAAHAAVSLAETQYALGRLGIARETLDGSVSLLRETGYLPGLAGALVTRVTLETAAGRVEDALATAAEARDVVDRLGDNALAATLAAAESQALCLAGRVEEGRTAATRALRRQRATTESPGEVIRLLSEAVLLGLAGGLLRDTDELPASCGPGPDPVVEALRVGALAMVEPGAPAEELDAAAEVLAGDGVGDARAAMRVVALWMRAEAGARRGDSRAAEQDASAALDAALDLGHRGYEAGIRRLLARLRDPPRSRPTTRE
jgi:tetratricopeptide (TPR) repeat protein/tRNA A-37 threonylcarbamoyl transferase component Bud32